MDTKKLKRGKKIDVKIKSKVIFNMLLEELETEIKTCISTKNEKQMHKCNFMVNFFRTNHDKFIKRIDVIVKYHDKDSSLYVDENAIIFSVFIIFKAEAYALFLSFLFDMPSLN